MDLFSHLVFFASKRLVLLFNSLSSKHACLYYRQGRNRFYPAIRDVPAILLEKFLIAYTPRGKTVFDCFKTCSKNQTTKSMIELARCIFVSTALYVSFILAATR